MQQMPKREEMSQVRDAPLDVWVHAACVPGRAHSGSVALAESAHMGGFEEKRGQRCSGVLDSHWDVSPSFCSGREGFCRK